MTLENTRKWRKTKRGLVTNLYHKMKGRMEVQFSLEDLHSLAKSKKFDRLFLEWEKSGYQKQLKPSIDRISNKKTYSLDNVHWLTWGENRYKQTMERRARKGRVAQILNGKTIKIFNSQRDAVRKTGVSQSCISAVLNGRRATANGCQWEYVK
jgi:hypothetical protein